MQLDFIEPSMPIYQQELDLRFRILRKPLGMPRGSEIFELESDCIHLVALDDGHLIGCVLFHPQTDTDGRLLQMAVDEPHQRKGIGRQLVRHLEDELARRGFREVILHARDIAMGFYEKLGYTPRGEPYVEVGIPHYTMARLIVG